MKVAAITLLLSMAGASALGIKGKSPMAVAARRMQQSVDKIQAFEMAMQSRRLEGHDGLDMAAMMNPKCQEACPGLADMMKSMMELMTQETTPPPAGKEGEAMAAMIQTAICPHMDAIKCMGTADACKSDTRRLDAHEGADPMEAIGCICACPDLAALGAGARRLDAHDSEGGDAAMAAMCANPEGTIGCMTKSEDCASMEAMMKKEMPESMQDNMMGYLGITCDYAAEKCEGKEEGCDKGEAADKEFQEKKCESPETTDKSQCCDAVSMMKECQGEKCMKLGFAMMSMSPEAGGMMDEVLKISKACPDLGMPTSKAEVEAVVKQSEAKMTGEDTAADGGGDASGAYTIPAFGMMTTVLAFAAVANV